MRPRKRSVRLNPTILLEIASHTAMGVALGLGFSLALTSIDAFGIATLIANSLQPRATLGIFVGTFTLAFAVGATLTGLVFTLMNDER
jgi:hypothetical protein